MKIALALCIGLIVGVAGTMVFTNSSTTEPAMSMNHEMTSMTQGLEGKTGDAFDQAFLSEMIVHHQGAVVMAEAALRDANHQEIKDLAQGIITAQNSEIQKMQEWQTAWYSK